ncbi:MAG: hypothetical protein ACFB0D_23390 [Phormidesmis sp.]
MKASFGVLTLSVLTSSVGSAVLVMIPAATAQSSYYYAGQAADGQPLMVDLGSIANAGEYDASFDYVLGEERTSSQAHCVGSGSWTTLSDGVVHRAQSQATREMLRVVCSYSASSTSVASLPPSSLASSSSPIEITVEPALSLPAPSSMAASVQTALVYDPSSNVRATPNGQIICSIDTRAYINIYGRLGDWYDTDACGTFGVIHTSQIQF